MEGAARFGCGEDEVELPDELADPERVAIAREELTRLRSHASSLTRDQRLVIGAQLVGAEAGEVCATEGWTREKYRKVAQRARGRLHLLLNEGGAVPGTRDASD